MFGLIFSSNLVTLLQFCCFFWHLTSFIFINLLCNIFRH